jgi:hypothetical protein
VPRGPSDRPIRNADAAAALQAAARQAQERGAAMIAPGPAARPDLPEFGVRVLETAPAPNVTGVRRTRNARALVLAEARKKGGKESADGERAPDPRGRGGALDVRV